MFARWCQMLAWRPSARYNKTDEERQQTVRQPTTDYETASASRSSCGLSLLSDRLLSAVSNWRAGEKPCGLTATEHRVANVLVVDDDRHIREVVRFALEKAGHRFVEAADGRAGLGQFRALPIDAVVLDIIMPEQDGLEVCRKLRERSQVPILFLSSRDDELDRVLGLEIGGDDYVSKPFSPRELVARVKALLRRAAAVSDPTAEAPLRRGHLLLDPQRYHCSS